MTSKEAVLRCIEFQNPDFLPVLYFNKDLEKSDFVILNYASPKSFAPKVTGENEWGAVWENHDDGTMGQAKYCPLETGYEMLENYAFPDAYAPGRFDEVQKSIAEASGKFLLGGYHLSGFAILTSLRGFENAMMDLYWERENFTKLLDRIAEFEMNIAQQYIDLGVDGIAFYDDWGSQSGLMISPKLWREIFKPVYKRQFDAIHQAGKKVYFHCCGDIKAILDDLIEIGADVLNLNQPDIFPIEYLSQKYRGKVCFNCPVDHQTVAIFGSDSQIHHYVDTLCSQLATKHGGYFGYIEEYKSVGMSDENYGSICNAFARHRNTCYEKNR